MYCKYFDLNKKPFQIRSDNTLFWPGKGYLRALDLLKRGIDGQQSLLLLTGDIGTGKTTLLNTLIASRDSRTRYVKIDDPDFELHALFSSIAKPLGFESLYNYPKSPKDNGWVPSGSDASSGSGASSEPIKFSQAFRVYLKQAENNGYKVLFIVDECQRIPKRFLYEIVAWSAFGLSDVLTVILAGQLDALDPLEEFLGRSWADVLDLHVGLNPLTLEETRDYIEKRLEISGSRQSIFKTSAIKEIFKFSVGIPRTINIACDQALIQAFADDTKTVDAALFLEAVKPLKLPVPTSPRSEKTDASTLEHVPAKTSRHLVPIPGILLKPGKITAGVAVTMACIAAAFFFHPDRLNVDLSPRQTIQRYFTQGPEQPAEGEGASMVTASLTGSSQLNERRPENKTDKKNEVLTFPVKAKPANFSAYHSSEMASPNQTDPVSEVSDKSNIDDHKQLAVSAPFKAEHRPVQDNRLPTATITDDLKNITQIIRDMHLLESNRVASDQLNSETSLVASATQRTLQQKNATSGMSGVYGDGRKHIQESSGQEVEPGAVIDWLIESKGQTKKMTR